jgi:type I restriction-modification system DNA methylase subunit
MKTPGKDKVKAFQQAKEYAEHLPPTDLPNGILISDFVSFDYYDLEKNCEPDYFTLADIPKKVELFADLAGYKDVVFQAVSPVDIKAAEHMGELYDALKDSGYKDHQLQMYLVRLLFCLFADDSGIFDEKKLFFKYIKDRTNVDGSDLALHLGQIFDTLNNPKENRLKNIDETLNKFRYINGGLFEERLETAAFTSIMRKTLLNCCTLDWSQIKPEIFGAMFQSVKDKEKRRELGEHYTSETNILKIIRSLFLDALWEEFEQIQKLSFALRKQRILEFHTKLRRLKFLDPACGCGNFLVVSYRELRLLEIEVLSEFLQLEKVIDIDIYVRVNVDQLYGIEIEEFPARIAQTALWLMDHLMNVKASERLGQYIVRLPLTATPTIVNTNALTTDWETIIPKDELSFILGNPPFLGASIMNKEQKKELENVFDNLKGCNSLDYVCCWYKKTAQYIHGTKIEAAFVSTNSICQGEQVPLLWPELISKHGIAINFAHQTFKWSNEARGKAAVYCIIIGFSQIERETKAIFQYPLVTSEPSQTSAKRINSYLIDSDNIFIKSRSTPICRIPEMVYGSKPTDGGNLLFTKEEKDAFLEIEPNAAKYIRPLISAHEYLHGKERFCLWLTKIEPIELKKLPHVCKRLEAVKEMRLASKKEATRFLADTPSLFEYIAHPDTGYIMIPCHSSENRKYIPMGFLDKYSIANNSCSIIPNGAIYHFGILTSTMHMAWVRCVCGRIKSDYRYSASIIYNNFPWPNPTEKQQKIIEELAQEILNIREKFPQSTLAALYDPLTMPKELLKAHQKLDKAVESAYGRSFDDDSQRVAYLFELYQKLTGELFVEEKKRGKGRKI